MGILLDTLGWIGAAVLLGAYGLLSFHKLRPRGGWYQGLNIGGSFLLVINTAYHRAFPSTAVNVIWIGIAVAAMFYGNRSAGSDSTTC